MKRARLIIATLCVFIISCTTNPPINQAGLVELIPFVPEQRESYVDVLSTPQDTIRTFFDQLVINNPDLLEDPNSFLHDDYVERFVTFEEEYNARIQEYDKILRECPVPLFIMDLHVFLDEFFMSMTEDIFTLRKGGILGMYVNGLHVKGWPEEFIFINKNMSSAHIMSTYFHEIKHYECISTKCICTKTTSLWLKEAHALEHEIEMSLKHDFPEVLRVSTLGVIKYMLDPDQPISYRFAAFRVHRRTMWTEAMEHLEIYDEKLLKD